MTREVRVENMQKLSGTDVRKCMKCGKCSGRCPAFKDMDIKPHQFVSMLGQGKIDQLLESKAIWNCLSCMACVERCPRGVAPANKVGVIDSDYRGEIKVALVNLGDMPYTITPGERVAQMMFLPVCTATLLTCDTLGETDRGAGGFGSTGKT